MNRTVKQLITAHRQLEGGGFEVRRPFPTEGLPQVDPFILLDELGPVQYAPGKAVGAPDHPHRGFETVTYVLEGENEHADSSGRKGKLGPGDVQWMTAGSGVVHSETPSMRLQTEGGRMHGFQIWVNLPARDKMMGPRYQEISREQIPEATSADGKARVKVIAGRALGVAAVIETRTPILYHHWTLQDGADVTTSIPDDFNACVYVFEGSTRVAGQAVNSGQLALLTPGETVRFEGGPAQLLLLGGVPLKEPIARYGPFVMNTEEEIHQAVRDFQSGKMGAI